MALRKPIPRNVTRRCRDCGAEVIVATYHGPEHSGKDHPARVKRFYCALCTGRRFVSGLPTN